MDMDFNSVYAKYSPKIYRVCLGYLNDHCKAKDITQETFITVWKKQESFRHQSDIGTWIYRIATNKCLRHIEVEQQYQNRESTLSEPEFHGTSETAAETMQGEKIQLLRSCIAELKEIDRLIIGLYLEELPQEYIAEVVGMSHTNIRVRVHRIKQQLKTKFKAHGQL